MEKIALLSNPVWHAMNSGNFELAYGGDLAKLFSTGISPFAGLKDFNRQTFEELWSIAPTENISIVSAQPIPTNTLFKTIHSETILQMVFKNTAIETTPNESVELTRAHVPAMIQLAELTKPGPFGENTIRFGGFHGIFEGDRLAAMAGRRFHANNFMEISGVCTHPDFLGRGYARTLMVDGIFRILQQGGTPYLHVKANNEAAIRLYQKIGFEIHQEMEYQSLRKIG